MKTSLNIPDWLVEDIKAQYPDMVFGDLLRDALLIARPVWAAEAAKGKLTLTLRCKIRLAEATAAQERAMRLAAEKAARASKRRPRAAKRAPASKPARLRPAAVKSPTTAAGPVDRNAVK